MDLQNMTIEQLMNLLASLYEKEKQIKEILRQKINER
jgi:hypothetical protein